jgi:hypothetical protein
MTATHTSVAELIEDIESVEHKHFMDSFFSSSEVYDDLPIKTGHAIAQAVTCWFPIVVVWV